MDDISSTQDLIKIVRTIANQEIKKSIVNIEQVSYGTITTVNTDGTFDVQIAGGKLISSLANKSGETLAVGNVVILKARNGNLGNGYIAVKTGSSSNA